GVSFDSFINWINPLIEVNGFLISWAIPAANSPTTDNFSFRNNIVSAAFNWVISRPMVNNPFLLLSSSKKGTLMTSNVLTSPFGTANDSSHLVETTASQAS